MLQTLRFPVTFRPSNLLLLRFDVGHWNCFNSFFVGLWWQDDHKWEWKYSAESKQIPIFMNEMLDETPREWRHIKLRFYFIFFPFSKTIGSTWRVRYEGEFNVSKVPPDNLEEFVYLAYQVREIYWVCAVRANRRMTSHCRSPSCSTTPSSLPWAFSLFSLGKQTESVRWVGYEILCQSIYKKDFILISCRRASLEIRQFMSSSAKIYLNHL